MRLGGRIHHTRRLEGRIWCKLAFHNFDNLTPKLLRPVSYDDLGDMSDIVGGRLTQVCNFEVERNFSWVADIDLKRLSDSFHIEENVSSSLRAPQQF